jgi:hypothetical protein
LENVAKGFARRGASGQRKREKGGKKGAFSHREPGQVKADVGGARATQPHEGRALSSATGTAWWLYPPRFRSMTGGTGSGLSVMFSVRVWGGDTCGYDCCLALPLLCASACPRTRGDSAVCSAERSDGNTPAISGVF